MAAGLDAVGVLLADLRRSTATFGPAELDAREVFGRWAAEKRIELLRRIDTGVPAMIQTDGSRLRQRGVNLESNAVKLTPSGEVEVTVTRPAPGGPRVFATRVPESLRPTVAEFSCPLSRRRSRWTTGNQRGAGDQPEFGRGSGRGDFRRGRGGAGARFRFTRPAGPRAELTDWVNSEGAVALLAPASS
jgi:hypothetical protein